MTSSANSTQAMNQVAKVEIRTDSGSDLNPIVFIAPSFPISLTIEPRTASRYLRLSKGSKMAEFVLPKNSRIKGKGREHKAPAGAKRVRSFRIYRYDPDSGENPRYD